MQINDEERYLIIEVLDESILKWQKRLDNDNSLIGRNRARNAIEQSVADMKQLKLKLRTS